MKNKFTPINQEVDKTTQAKPELKVKFGIRLGKDFSDFRVYKNELSEDKERTIPVKDLQPSMTYWFLGKAIVKIIDVANTGDVALVTLVTNQANLYYQLIVEDLRNEVVKTIIFRLYGKAKEDEIQRFNQLDSESKAMLGDKELTGWVDASIVEETKEVIIPVTFYIPDEIDVTKRTEIARLVHNTIREHQNHLGQHGLREFAFATEEEQDNALELVNTFLNSSEVLTYETTTEKLVKETIEYVIDMDFAGISLDTVRATDIYTNIKNKI